jgi:hypothetical protein
MGSALLAFALTNYQFNQEISNSVLDFICRMLTLPLLFSKRFFADTPLENMMGSVPAVFSLLFFFYSALTVVCYKFLKNRTRLPNLPE